MIAMDEETWRWLVALGFCVLVLVIGMFVYVVKASRLAYLGERWIRAAGSRRRAAVELRNFEHMTETLLVQHGYRFPPGLLVSIDRESIERLIEAADQAERREGGGGPGL
jgi:hypothetical protein